MNLRFVSRWWWNVTSRIDWDAWAAQLSDAGDGCSDCGCALTEHIAGGCNLCELCDGYQ